MIFAYLLLVVFGYLAGHLLQKGDRVSAGLAGTGVVVFALTGTAFAPLVITVGIAGGLGYLLSRFGYLAVGAALIMVGTSAVLFYYMTSLSDSFVAAILFTITTASMVRMFVKDKKRKSWAYTATSVFIVITLLVLTLVS